MRIISALFDNPIKPYKEMAANLKECAARLGYPIEIYDLSKNPNEAEDRASGYYRVRFEDKLPLLMRLMETAPEEEKLAWIDVDCLIAQRFDDVLIDCDIAVPLRRQDGTQGGTLFDAYTNTGVFFFRNCSSVRAFFRRWFHVTVSSRDDQEAMNKILLEEGFGFKSCPEYDYFGDIVLKTVPCDLYNCFYFDGADRSAAILHFKGQFDRVLYSQWVERLKGVVHGLS